MLSLLQGAVVFGTVTFIIGSALMAIPFKGIWWAYLGTFWVGFISYYALSKIEVLSYPIFAEHSKMLNTKYLNY